ncbi:MAG: DUF4271 domain-containing protein [Daejeonella sp.]
MIVKFVINFFLIVLLFQLDSYGQIDSSKIIRKNNSYSESSYYSSLDSVANAKKKTKDSIKVIGDSLSFIWIKVPNPKRPNQFLDSLIKTYHSQKFDFSIWAKKNPKKKDVFNAGKVKPTGERWVIMVILFLIILFAIIKTSFQKETISIWRSFYSYRILNQINKEGNLFNSWPFIFLYVLFGFIMGMYLYLSWQFFQPEYIYRGFSWFLILSAIIIGAFTLKIIILKLLGFLFGIQKLLQEYIGVLYLIYFNVAIILLPLLIAFSLASPYYSKLYIYIAFLILIIVFVLQLFRAGSNILFNYKFPKVYLFIYLCALEICPLLILIKALKV